MISSYTQIQNMKKVNKVYLLIISILLLSCNDSDKSYSSREKVFSYNGQQWKSHTKTHFAKSQYYRATEVPNLYYLLKNEDNLDVSIEEALKSTEEERVIEFEFEHFEAKDLLLKDFTNLEYEDAVKYMSFKIRKDFSVVTSKNDTISCNGVHFERHFKISPLNRVLLYFNGIPATESIQLVYNDNLFNNGIFKFKFEEEPIKL